MSDFNGTCFDDRHHQGDESHLLMEVSRTYQVLTAGFSRAMGMPASRFALMRLVALADRDIGVMDLARQLGVNAAAVTRQVQELERDGLVRRRADPKDRRRSALSLSRKGQRRLEIIHERNHELEQTLAAELGAEEMKRAAAVLAKLRIFIEARR